MEEDYEVLLSPKRRRKSTRDDLGALQESESDRARILYSSAFRRLQRKTQVFPLEENAAVRSRLTHSLEVAHVGRFIATSVVKNFKDGDLLGKYNLSEENCLALANMVETACLAHDIGNPPFGHFGEAAISAWAEKLALKFGGVPDAEVNFLRDFLVFDGNPQGLRVVTSIAGVDSFGMNLTAAQIASTVKYPCFSNEIDANSAILKKAGVFSSESQVWRWVRDSLGLENNKRFPVAFLMEAADDISYCLSDIEDGIEKGYTNHKDFYSEVRKNLGSGTKAEDLLNEVLSSADKNAEHVDPTVYARTALVRKLVEEAAATYVKKHSEIFSGNVSELLNRDSPAYQLLKAIKDTVKSKLYGHRKPVELELTGCAAITGILSKYEALVGLDNKDFASLGGAKVRPGLVEAQRLYSLLAPKYVKAYERGRSERDNNAEIYARVQLIVDFVSGMTDVFALQTYQVITGIRSG